MEEKNFIEKVNALLGDAAVALSVKDANHSQGHPYCIGARHVVHASEHFSGMLGDDAIRSLEKEQGGCCMTKGCTATYDEHKSDKILFIQLKRNLENAEAAQTFFSIKPLMAEEKIDGICFVDTPEKYRIAPPIKTIEDENATSVQTTE